MRLIVAAAIVGSLLAAPALANGIALNLDDGAQGAAAQMPAMVDSCVSGLMLRNDPTVCRTISAWLAALANEVKTAQVAAAKKIADEAAKKAADDAAKKAADEADTTRKAADDAAVDKKNSTPAQE